MYGNTYRKLKKGEYKLNPGGRPLDNAWTSYFRPANKNLNVGKFVEKVTWQLHPTFRDPMKRYYEAPFEHSCPGCWGYFDLPFTVYWKEWTGLKKLEPEFELDFSEGGGQHVGWVKFKREDLEKQFPKMFGDVTSPPAQVR